ncbi:class I SAM-dependent methyltransferase [Paenibacillus radicis (ex Xue et al. 2023)]|uniref:Class I SAM-dependent methyltransferase n=1 Tax=Paenibacillus radicis (ex Xue et al. 2023) TaxID=2972489 RepID=A0ABT1YS28_9BACL|nr:class I SAM-dependent methyltransferase [Paenibacillus radicis (ex Xue et al. 2023)]MCR8635989.1 class I SAM-dependent methyltransferase [Paenibacillus radicis (ex Xue et al. 2023)]
MSSEIIKANIEVHTIMADQYNSEPHFRPENQAKVKNILKELRNKGGKKHLDLGCGTGFIINLAKDLFEEIHGVDVTKAMLDKVDISSGNITLHNIPAENLPFNNDYFDIVTAYSFIHHVENYEAILKEAFRVLKPGGIFYIDLEPNKLFWKAISEINEEKVSDLSDLVKKEINSVLHTDEIVQKEFGIDKEIFNKAEYIKNILGGIDPHEFKQTSLDIGFSKCDVNYQWYLGQGSIMHGVSFEAAETIEGYLQKINPLSEGLFKYLRFILIK